MKISKFKLFSMVIGFFPFILFSSCTSKNNNNNSTNPLHYSNNKFLPERNFFPNPQKTNDSKMMVKNVTVINKTVFIKQKRKNEKPTIRNLKPNKPKNNDSKKSINLKKSKK